MRERYTIEIAGQALSVTADHAAHAFRAPLSRIESADPGNASAGLLIGVSQDPRDDPRFAGLGTGQYRAPGGTRVYVAENPAHIQAFRQVQVGQRSRAELELLLSPPALESGDLIAQPAYNAVFSWMAASGNVVMHAAGVSVGGRGLLLIGDGGHGKTTTAVAACQRGFRYLGDDLCVVSLDGSGGAAHRMHGVYATAKLNDDSRDRLGAAGWTVVGSTRKSKSVVLLPPHIEFDRSVRIAAVVHVGHAGTGVARRGRLSPSAAWRAIARASTPALSVTGTTPQWLRAMSALARDVPTFSMPLDWDLDRAVGALAQIAAEAIT